MAKYYSKSVDKTFKLHPPQVGKKFLYSNIIFDHDGFVSTSKALPCPYDMLTVKTLSQKGTYPAWFTGSSWEIPKLRKYKYKVIEWKLQKFDE